jgi:Esterase/lipase
MGLMSSFGLDPALEAAMRADGYVFNAAAVERSRALFAPTKDLSLPPGGRRLDDLAYGPDPRQRLDICRPEGEGHPVVIFVPGGGFVGGDKAFYAHVPAFLARAGLVGIALNYRLAPDHPYPAGGQDVSRAIDWVAASIHEHGGDPARLHVIGQSAGATHVASALFDPRCRAQRHGAIRAAALMSGIYDAHPDFPAPTVNQYFGNDPKLCAESSPIAHVQNADLPVVMTHAELEPEFFGVQASKMFAALNRRLGHAPTFAVLKGHNHLSPVLGMGNAGDRLGTALLQEFGLVG